MVDALSRTPLINIGPSPKVFCVSHRDDVDGLVSAALVRRATKCRFGLAMYEDMEKVLADVPGGLDWLVLADLGLSERTEIIRSLPKLASNILYVDHHLLSTESRRLLRRTGVLLRHSLRESTSVLVWDAFRAKLPREAIGVAAYGAVTDPPVSGRLTREVLEKTSRNVSAYEGNLLALALSSEKCTVALREEIVRRLASMQLPHRMPKVSRLADQQAARMPKIQRRLQERGQVRGRVIIAEAGGTALGTSAELLLTVPDIVVSVAYDPCTTPSRTRISVRGTDECRKHLGRLMAGISTRMRGGGGGHRLAAGAIIPRSRLREFLRLFVEEVER